MEIKQAIIMAFMGKTKDRFGESGGPWELMMEFHLTAEHIAAKAKTLLQQKP